MLEPGVKKLIAPARKSMITTAIITSIGGTCAIVPYIAITEIAANWFRGSPSDTLWLWVGVAIPKRTCATSCGADLFRRLAGFPWAG